MPGVCRHDESGDLRTGFFYCLDTRRRTDNYDDLVFPSIYPVREDRPALVASASVQEREVIEICESVPDHRTEHWMSTRVEVHPCEINDLHYFDESLIQFVHDRDHVMANAGLGDRLAAEQLRGLKLLLCNVEASLQKGIPPQVFLVRGSGFAPFRTRVIDPLSMNLCPWCQASPALCTACGERFDRCLRCNRVIFCLPIDTWRGSEDRRIRWAPEPLEGPILEARRWNGDDIMGESGPIITGKMLGALIGCGARGFAVTPVRTDVTGVTDKQWTLLEEASCGEGFRGIPWTGMRFGAPKAV